jgi:hypothetical protein
MMVSALSSLTLLALGALGLSPHLHPGKRRKKTTLDAPTQPTEAATELVARLQTLLQKDPLFLPGSDSKPPCPTPAGAGQRPVKGDQKYAVKRLAVRQPSPDCPCLRAAKARSKYHQRFVRQRLSDQIKF